MDMIDNGKITRIFIAVLSFMCVMTICGLPTRDAHQFIFMLGSMVLFGLLLDNLWITLFLWWTVFLFCYFQFNTGWIYVSNIFYGCVIYYLVKKNFKKEHIQFYINIVLWILVINLLYGCAQVLNLDFIWKGGTSGEMPGLSGGEVISNPIVWGTQQNAPIGFMGNTSVMASFIALCFPLILAKRTKLSYITSAMLLLPLYFLRSSLNMAAIISSSLFVLWFILPKKIWFAVLGCLFISGLLYIRYVDAPGLERMKLWRVVMVDAKDRPIVGWGLDSFRNITSVKKHTYNAGLARREEGYSMGLWDNPHNLYMSLAFEFGFVSWLLLGGYLRQLGLWFKKAAKDYETIALAGFTVSLLTVSAGHFPVFLARLMVIIVPCAALFEIKIRKETYNGFWEKI